MSARVMSIVLAALLGAPAAAPAVVLNGPDVKVAYGVDAIALKAAISGTMLTFTLYSDSSCTTTVYTQTINVENTDMIESVKRVTPKGATKPPKTALIHATLIGVPPGSAGFLKVTGTGITGVGGDCQAQAGGAASSPVIAYAVLNQGGPGVDSFGGNGTTGAALDFATGGCLFASPPGSLCVTFTGSYPTGPATTNLTVLSSAGSGNYGVTNTQVIVVSDTSITVEVFSWKSDDLTNTGESLRVAVLYGM